MQVAACDLGHRFGVGPFLFRRVSFEITSGKVASLTGPSGSGKSTLLSLIAGWLTPTEGSVEFSKTPLITWVPQSPLGIADRTALDHVTFPAIACGLTREQADANGQNLLQRFGLDGVADRPFRLLSGGERQRLMLARAVNCRANVILVDEPTAQLDPASAKGTLDAMAEMTGQDWVVLIATHDPRVQERCTLDIRLGAT